MHSRFQCAQQTGVPSQSDIVTFINARGVTGGKKTEYFDLKSFFKYTCPEQIWVCTHIGPGFTSQIVLHV